MYAKLLQPCLTLQPCGLYLTRLFCPWDSPGKNNGVSCHALLQGIFPTQGSNMHLSHCKWILYRWAIREAHIRWCIIKPLEERNPVICSNIVDMKCIHMCFFIMIFKKEKMYLLKDLIVTFLHFMTFNSCEFPCIYVVNPDFTSWVHGFIVLHTFEKKCWSLFL